MSVKPPPRSLAPVGPADCALAIGIPLTRNDFFSDLTDAQHDYAAAIKTNNPHLSGEGLWRRYKDLAGYAVKVCEAVQQAGVKVIPQARLTDLAGLFENYAVVTVVAHAAWPEIGAGDIADPAGLLRKIKTSRGPIPGALRTLLKEAGLGRSDAAATSRERQEVLIHRLREITHHAHAWYENEAKFHTPDITAASASFPAHHLTRPALELAFPGSITPGRAIELRDGLHTLPELIAVMPEHFSGILDLTMCNSAILGPAIKQARPDCILAINRAPASPDVRFARYRVIIKQLQRTPAPFGQVLADVHSAWLERGLDP